MLLLLTVVVGDVAHCCCGRCAVGVVTVVALLFDVVVAVADNKQHL